MKKRKLSKIIGLLFIIILLVLAYIGFSMFMEYQSDEQGTGELVRVEIESGEIRPSIYKVLPMEKAIEAHGILERCENVGKVVLKVCDE